MANAGGYHRIPFTAEREVMLGDRVSTTIFQCIDRCSTKDIMAHRVQHESGHTWPRL